MKGQDYPILHFEMMRELAIRLKTFPVQILEHTYRYDVFGSWWFTFMKQGVRYRIVYDGKDFCLRLEQNAHPILRSEWQEMHEESVAEKGTTSVIGQILSLIDRS